MDFGQILRLLALGAGHTILVTFACILTGLGVGLAVAVLRRLSVRGTAWLVETYTYVFRAVPVLVLLFIMFFGLPAIGLKVPPMLSMMLSLGLIAGAYLAEVFRGSMDALDPQELVAAEAMGLGRWQVLISIELPQMLRLAVPGMLNEFTTVLKYSPFAYTVGIPEITRQATALASTTLRGIEIYLAAGLLYFGIFQLLRVGVRAVEKRFEIPGFGTH